MEMILFLLGLCLGSFLNVCIYRIPKNQSIVYPPSSCTSCKEKIKLPYILPVLGYLLSKGRCFNCREKISLQYPIVELVSAFMAIIIYHATENLWQTLYFYNFFMVLFAITIIDIKTMTIPNKMILYLLLTALPYIFTTFQYKNIIVATALGIFFFAILLLSRGGMGGGDVKLAFVMGIYLGFPLAVLAVFLAFILGGLVGIILLLGGESRKKAIPFGPYLAIGSAIAFLLGDKIINWYLNFIYFI